MFSHTLQTTSISATLTGLASYAFNGKEKDDEWAGEGNFQDYGKRMYDTRVCRFISVDPLTMNYPMLTPYQFSSNSPISGKDRDGLEFYYAPDGSFLRQGPDPKCTDVYVEEKVIEKAVTLKPCKDVLGCIPTPSSDHSPNRSGTGEEMVSIITEIEKTVETKLELNNDEFLDRVHWVYGETSGNEDALSIAFAIKNAKEFYGFKTEEELLNGGLMQATPVNLKTKEAVKLSGPKDFFSGKIYEKIGLDNPKANPYDEFAADKKNPSTWTTLEKKASAAIINSLSGKVADPVAGKTNWYSTNGKHVFYGGKGK